MFTFWASNSGLGDLNQASIGFSWFVISKGFDSYVVFGYVFRFGEGRLIIGFFEGCMVGLGDGWVIEFDKGLLIMTSPFPFFNISIRWFLTSHYLHELKFTIVHYLF